jgi:hypothetical protein
MSNETQKPSINLWPISIIAFFTVAVCGAVSFTIFSTRQHVDLVTADYYEQEVRYQDHLDRVNRAASLQAPAQIGYDTATKLITVTLPAEHLNQPLKGWIQLYRPSSATLDQKLNLQVDAAGHQNISAANLSDGLWHVRVSWTMNGADYYYDQKLIIGGKQNQT